MKTLPEVSSKYGAPMGRSPQGAIPDHGAPLRTRRLKWVDGDYDAGGAYWGANSTESIYWLYSQAEDEDFERFYRATSYAAALALFREEAGTDQHAVAFDTIEPSQDARDFLTTLLFAYPWETAEEPDEQALKETEWRPEDFAPAFINALEDFLTGFRAYLRERSLAGLLDDCERSFGGNVYFSLSGNGCGFGIDEGEAGAQLQAALEEYSSNNYRFEGIDLLPDADENLNLSLKEEFLAEGIRKLFSTKNR